MEINLSFLRILKNEGIRTILHAAGWLRPVGLRHDGAQQAMSNDWLRARGCSASKTCGVKPRATGQLRVEGFVVTQAHSLNRPLRARTVGGVGAGS